MDKFYKIDIECRNCYQRYTIPVKYGMAISNWACLGIGAYYPEGEHDGKYYDNLGRKQDSPWHFTCTHCGLWREMIRRPGYVPTKTQK